MALLFVSSRVHAQTISPQKRKLSLELEPLEGAKFYEVLLKREASKFSSKFKLKGMTWTASLNPGSYLFQVRSVDERGVPGEWTEPQVLEVLAKPVVLVMPQADQVVKSEGETEATRLEWKSLGEKYEYKVQVWRNEELVVDEQTDETALNVDLPKGAKYTWSVTGKSQDVQSEKQKNAFVLAGNKLSPPEWKDVTLSNKIFQAAFEKAVNTQKVDVSALRASVGGRAPSSEKSIYQKNAAQSPLRLSGKLPDGVYKLEARASAEYWESSNSAVKYFEVENGQLGEVADSLEEIQNKITKQRKYYVTAGLQAYGAKNTSQDYDRNSNLSFNRTEGVAVDLGAKVKNYWHSLGAEVEFTYATFDVQAQTTLTSQTWDARYLLNWFWEPKTFINEFTLKAGLFYSEVPQFSGDATLTNVGLQYARVMGPALGFDAEFPLFSKLTLNFGMLAMFPTESLQTPDNRKIKNGEFSDAHISVGVPITSDWVFNTGLLLRNKKIETESQTDRLNLIKQEESSLRAVLRREF